MSKRNVERLAELLMEAENDESNSRAWMREVAERLAARGVLAVDALRGEEDGAAWDAVVRAGDSARHWDFDAARAALRRLATGGTE